METPIVNGGLICPLCCRERFESRADLRAHLAKVVHELHCPECELLMPSVAHLVLHLDSECTPVSSVTNGESQMLENHTPEIASQTDVSRQNAENFQDLVKLEISHTSQTETPYVSNSGSPLNDTENEDNHILIVDSETGGILDKQSIITTQNEDGTISFTQVGPEMSNSAEGEEDLRAVAKDAEEMCEGESEVYSCNTCGVSFTSVMQHIQKYHSEQDVVVEVAESEPEGPTEELQGEVVGNKRVITASGDIIMEREYQQYVICQDSDSQGVSSVQEVTDKSGLTYKRRLVKINKFWDENVQGNKAQDITNVDIETLDEPLVLDDGETVSQVFSCRKCHYKSVNVENMETHECKAVYSCTQCDYTYTNPKSLCAHMKVHKSAAKTRSPENVEKKPAAAVAEPVQMTFKCSLCDTIFPSNKSLRLHKRMHDPIKTRPMEGPVSYETDPDGDSEDMFHCETCGKWIHVGYRDIHHDYHHTTSQYHCEICNRKFLSQDYLVMHMNVHNVEKINTNKIEKGVLPYSCIYCNRQFARPHEKVKHERIHTGEKPHTCEICGKAFRVSYCLTLHMRTHTGARPYECPHCFKRFKAHSVYNHHLLTHSDVRAYKCPFCPKAFKTSVQLAGHKNSHTKPFSCKHCNRPFASLYAVRVHTETHRRQNNLKFSCKLCGASYARAFALKDHMRSSHGAQHQESQNGLLDTIDPSLAMMGKVESKIEIDDMTNSVPHAKVIII